MLTYTQGIFQHTTSGELPNKPLNFPTSWSNSISSLLHALLLEIALKPIRAALVWPKTCNSFTIRCTTHPASPVLYAPVLRFSKSENLLRVSAYRPIQQLVLSLFLLNLHLELSIYVHGNLHRLKKQHFTTCFLIFSKKKSSFCYIQNFTSIRNEMP